MTPFFNLGAGWRRRNQGLVRERIAALENGEGTWKD